MNAKPLIIVQVVHIEGPLKGQIQGLTDDEILIGRHPACQVKYPKDMVILSRRHARIVREGNRFKLIDHSTNGTYVNGRPVAEANLNSGDVITFAEYGPKFSFLTQVGDPAMVQQAPAPQPPPAAPKMTASAPDRKAAAAPPGKSTTAPPKTAPTSTKTTTAPPKAATAAAKMPTAAPASMPAAPDPVIEYTQVPFVIQYGAALKSFQTLPITLGKGGGCHFLIDQPGLNDHQAQIFYAQDQYWIKDLTGNNMIQINGLPIVGQSVLQPDMQIALSPKGPHFRFLGGGRLAQVEDDESKASEGAPASRADTPPAPESEKASSGGFFKKFFR